MNVGIACYASIGGSGVIASELGKTLAARGHRVHILSNDTPFIAFRSLSDLAGGDPGANQAPVFFQLASDNSAAVVQRFLTLWTPPR